MINLLRSESYKMRKNKVFWVLTTIIISIAFISVLLFFLAEKGIITSVEEEGFVIIEVNQVETEFTPTSGMSFFVGGMDPDWAITVLLISVLGAFMIAKENASGTIKNLVSIGYNRAQIYLSKLTIYFIGVIILHLLISVSFGFFGTLFFGVGDILVLKEIIEVGKIGLLVSLYLFAFTTIVMFFSMIVKGSGVAILTSFTIFFSFGPFLTYLSQKYLLFEKINHYSVYHRFMTIVGSDLNQSKVLLELILVPVITAIIFVCLGIFAFQRKDIQ